MVILDFMIKMIKPIILVPRELMLHLFRKCVFSECYIL